MQYSLQEIGLPAERIIQKLNTSRLILFNAEMGSGKTTLIAAICKQLQVGENISSPTYAIVNEYFSNLLQKKIAHIDLYRLKNEDELLSSGVLDYVQDQQCICLIEWPDLLMPYIKEYIGVSIQWQGEQTRSIYLSE